MAVQSSRNITETARQRDRERESETVASNMPFRGEGPNLVLLIGISEFAFNNGVYLQCIQCPLAHVTKDSLKNIPLFKSNSEH